MKKINQISLAFLLISITYFFSSCNDMKVGYLQTENAVFVPDTLVVTRTIEKESIRYKNQAPWTSLRIQGVAGTSPINYEFEDVKSENSEKEALFRKAVEDKEVVVIGGIIQMHLTAVDKLPNGRYKLSIRVYNEDHSSILEDAFTFIIVD